MAKGSWLDVMVGYMILLYVNRSTLWLLLETLLRGSVGLLFGISSPVAQQDLYILTLGNAQLQGAVSSL